MESSVVEISTPAREREKESNEGNEGQKHALAEYLFFARAARNFFVHADFSQICHRISLQIVGGSVYKCLLQFNSLIYILIPTLPLIVTISFDKFEG